MLAILRVVTRVNKGERELFDFLKVGAGRERGAGEKGRTSPLFIGKEETLFLIHQVTGLPNQRTRSLRHIGKAATRSVKGGDPRALGIFWKPGLGLAQLIGPCLDLIV